MERGMGNSAGDKPTTRHHLAALRLLRKLIALESFPPEAIARALVVSEAAMSAYLSESKPIPLERQLCLALFVIERVPSLARPAHQLRGQVAATMAFLERADQGIPTDVRRPFLGGGGRMRGTA